MNSGAYYTSVPSGKVSSAVPAASSVYTSAVSSRARPSAAGSLVSSTPESGAHSTAPSALPSTVATASQAERSHSQSRSERKSASSRPTIIIRPKIIGVPIDRDPSVPAHTFISTAISLILYLAVMIIIFSVECPFDRDVGYFSAFVLLAFTGSLFTLIINLTAIRHHRFNCANTSLSLLYSGSAVLVIFGLIHTGIYGLCKPAGSTAGSIFVSGVTSNYFIWVMTGLSALWQLVAHYYYG